MSHRALIALYIFLGLLFVTPVVIAQPTPSDTLHTGYTTEGTEFWVVFQKNFRDFVTDPQTSGRKPAEPLHLELFITSSKTARGTVEIPGIGFSKSFVVPAGRVIPIVIDTAAQVRSSEKIENRGVHITADQPVAVYGLNRRYQTTDTYLAYPVSVLGTSYRAVCYRRLESDLLSQVAIVGVKENTHVKITPTMKTAGNKPPGVPFEVTLNPGEVYQIIPRFDVATTSDLTGTLIESDEPVAVFSGHNCAYVPDFSTKACNLLVEQLPPLNAWGTQFFVGTLAGRSSSALRVVAQQDGTNVFENNRLVKTLNAGEAYDNTDLRVHTMVKSDKPVLVTQFSKGFDNGDNVGDPMMIIVAPTEQFLSSYRFATPVRGSWHHYINVIASTSSIPQLRLDEKAINPTLFLPFGISTYSIGQIEVAYGTHVISGPEPFGLYSYGFGYDDASYDAYGNGGGQSMEKVIPHPDTMAPMLSAVWAKSRTSLSVVARDDRVNDTGLDGVEVMDDENVTYTIPGFESGTPQVPIVVRLRDVKHNAYAQFRLRDREGNVSYYTLCMKYDELADSLSLSVLTGNQSCDFSHDLMFSLGIKYSVIDNTSLTLAVNSDLLRNPVELKGDHGRPVWGVHAFAELPYTHDLFFVGRIGLDFWKGDAFGYFADSLRNRAPDGVLITEEFQLHRTMAMLTLAPGVEYFFVEKKAYVFGNMNISLPISVSETLTRTVQSPSNYVYGDGNRTITMYDGSGPSGIPLILAPELGIGGLVDLRKGWKIFCELGYGRTLSSISPDRDWTVDYVMARFGAKMKF